MYPAGGLLSLKPFDLPVNADIVLLCKLRKEEAKM